MRYFPIFIEFGKAQTVLVYGGGDAALCKVRLLLKTRVSVSIIATGLHDELATLVNNGRITWHSKGFSPDQLDAGVTAVFAATDDHTNASVSAAARARNIAVNAVDRPDLSSFIVPAIVDRDPLVIAIGTEGAGPVLAQGLRARIETMLAPGIGALLERARELRAKVATLVPEGAARRSFWNGFFFGPIRDAFFRDDEPGYQRALTRHLAAHDQNPAGRVTLITAPADCELLTLKAHRLLQEADVIVHDADITPDVLDYARRDAERRAVRINVWSADPANIDLQLAAELAAQARSGLSIVRLFSADTTNLEAEVHALRAALPGNCPLEVIPSPTTTPAPWAPLCGADYCRSTVSQLRIAS